VLVVDDEPRVREVLVTLISLDDHLVDTADDGLDALDKIAAHEYDVILCDLAMPSLDGPGLYAELERSRPDLLGRLVIVSANAESPKYQGWLARTHLRVIRKPFDQSEISAAIRGKDPE
jgi:CheY-like chemotaxis protein